MAGSDAQGVFLELVRQSRARHDEAFRNQRIDDVFLGSVIAGTVRSGYSLIGLNSDGVNHHLRFEHLSQATRLLFRLTHLSEDVTVARVRGHLASVVIGYGEPVRGGHATLNEMSDDDGGALGAPAEPGVITVSADTASGYGYAQIELVLDLDRYIMEDLLVELGVLQQHLESVVAALRTVLHGRAAPAAAVPA